MVGRQRMEPVSVRLDADGSRGIPGEQVTQELADELALTHAEVADLAQEHHTLGEAIRTTTARDEAIKDALRPWMELHGDIEVEGLPRLYLENRSTTTWDCIAMYRDDRATFERLLELGCITVNTQVAKEQAKAGNIVTNYRRFSYTGAGKPAVKWDRR